MEGSTPNQLAEYVYVDEPTDSILLFIILITHIKYTISFSKDYILFILEIL